MSKVIELGLAKGQTLLPIEANSILEGAKGELDTCFVIGFRENGSLYTASTTSAIAENILLLEMAKKAQLELLQEDDYV